MSPESNGDPNGEGSSAADTDSGARSSPADRDPDPASGPAATPGEVTFTPPVPEPREYVGPGVLLGLLAWALCYGLVLGGGTALSTLDSVDAAGVPTWQVGVWLLFDAHLAPVALAGGPVDSLVADLGDRSLALAAVPVVVLAVGARFAVNRVGVPGPREGALAGAAVALGYLLPVTAAAVAVEGTVQVAAVTYPLTPTVAVAVGVGLVYPAVVGGLVGALSS